MYIQDQKIDSYSHKENKYKQHTNINSIWLEFKNIDSITMVILSEGKWNQNEKLKVWKNLK